MTLSRQIIGQFKKEEVREDVVGLAVMLTDVLISPSHISESVYCDSN